MSRKKKKSTAFGSGPQLSKTQFIMKNSMFNYAYISAARSGCFSIQIFLS